MSATIQHPFEGMVIIPAQQLADIVAVITAKAVREELDRREAATTNPATDLPDEVPAAQAAKYCGYKTGKSLVKFHHTDLKPLRVNGKRIFYAKAEVVKLKKKIFNQ